MYMAPAPTFRESISWIISPFKFWTATIFLHAHLQVVYYKCVKFHKNPISRLGGVVLTRYMDGRKDGRRTGWFLYTPKLCLRRYEKLLNSNICHSGCPNYCNCLFLFSGRLGRGRGCLRLTTWLFHYKKPDSHPAVMLNSFKFSAPVVFISFWLFFSCLK
jgi:hypothetical protein